MITIIAECATAHGGDIEIAKAMIDAAADAGADYVKFQHWQPESLNPRDPQAEWLHGSRLSNADVLRLSGYAADKRLAFLCTPFDRSTAVLLAHAGVPIKIASTDALSHDWDIKPAFVSYPWGCGAPTKRDHVALTAVPLYPTPLECLNRVEILDGWSDHCASLAGCYWAIGCGATTIEVHLTIPGARHMPFDKSVEDFRALRQYANDYTTIEQGFSHVFSTRWKRSA